MNQIVRHIEYLLRSGDGCVVIPGVGAVLSRRVSACFDASTGRFMPPAVEYSFNGALSRSDGALASSVARSRGITYEQAARIVDEAASDMRRALREGSSVMLGRIGSLARTDGRVVFTPVGRRQAASSAQWFEPLAVRLLVAAQSEAAVLPDDESRVIASAVARAWRRGAVRAARVAASVALVLALGFAVAMTLGRTAPDAQRASIGFEFAAPAKERPALIPRPGTSSSPLVLVLRNHDDAATVVDTLALAAARSRKPEGRALASAKASLAAPAVAVSAESDADRYCYVIASLSTRAEAERYVAARAADGVDLRILDNAGRFRVYAASGSSSASLRRIVAEAGLDSRYPGAWICRR